MLLRDQMETLINKMLDGRILLVEAIAEFEKIYIQKALERNSDHFCNTAAALGIHRNTLSKRVTLYSGKPKKSKRVVAKPGGKNGTSPRSSARSKTARKR